MLVNLEAWCKHSNNNSSVSCPSEPALFNYVSFCLVNTVQNVTRAHVNFHNYVALGRIQFQCINKCLNQSRASLLGVWFHYVLLLPISVKAHLSGVYNLLYAFKVSVRF